MMAPLRLVDMCTVLDATVEAAVTGLHDLAATLPRQSDAERYNIPTFLKYPHNACVPSHSPTIISVKSQETSPPPPFLFCNLTDRGIILATRRKRALLQHLHTTKQRLLRLHVVTEWGLEKANAISQVSKVLEVSQQHTDALRDAADQMAYLHGELSTLQVQESPGYCETDVEPNSDSCPI